MPRRWHQEAFKKPKRYEVNYLPEVPEGENDDNLEAQRKLLDEEMKKQNPSGAVIASKMDQNLSLRRREIMEASSFYRETSKN